MGKLKDTARKISEKVSKDILPNQHLGSHSFETLWQSLYSLENTKPMFRDEKWHKNARNCRALILNGIAKQKPKFQTLIQYLNHIEAMR